MMRQGESRLRTGDLNVPQLRSLGQKGTVAGAGRRGSSRGRGGGQGREAVRRPIRLSPRT